MQFQYIDTQEAFDDRCRQALNADYVALDTEFVRTRTYYPKLGLIQLFDGQNLSLIDALAIDDWALFKELLSADKVIKVLHSCSEDLEVFWHQFKTMPAPLFDTQFAAGLAGVGFSVGYAKLVSDMLDVALDKGESRTDWLQRPLRPEQLDYAANDVIYLYQLYPMLHEKLQAEARESWVFQEMAQLANKKSHPIPSDYHYLNIKNNWQLLGLSLMVLKDLATWRMNKARSRDSALNFIVRETCLLDIAQRQPEDKRQLAGLGCLGGKELRLYGDEIIEVIQNAQNKSQDLFPNKVMRLSDRPGYKKVLHAIRELCIKKAESLGIKSEVFASKNQVNQFLKWYWFETNEFKACDILPDLATGWRKELVYDQILSVLNGQSPD